MILERLRGVNIGIFVMALFFLIGSFVVVVSFLFVENENVITDWKMTVVGINEVYQTGQIIDIHVFLEDESNESIENADVSLVLDRPETVHHLTKVMHRLEDGLYEAEAILSVPGIWIGMVEASRGKDVYRNQFLLKVEGSVIGEPSRDPADHFSLDQYLPDDVQQKVESYESFDR
ncbi:FixH family protein [Bacillus sp. FJAT-45037]|uniref:FixH family protein n=1 Tax=Bacillus sp. FJAT-45037 TaxID=2011007 RepID=UPI0012FD2701|nr:FixH family protein [Bacillus sp. FJAT-45037]